MQNKKDLKKLYNQINKNAYLKGNISQYKDYFNQLRDLLKLFWTYREKSFQISKISGLLFLHDIAKAILYSKLAMETISGNVQRENETEEEWEECLEEDKNIVKKYEQSILDFLEIIDIFLKTDQVNYYFAEFKDIRFKLVWLHNKYIVDFDSFPKDQSKEIEKYVYLCEKNDIFKNINNL